MSGPRTESGKQAVKMRGLFGGETAERATKWVRAIEAEAAQELDVERLAQEIGRHQLAFNPDGSPTCACDGPWDDDHWFEEHVAANILARLESER